MLVNHWESIRCREKVGSLMILKNRWGEGVSLAAGYWLLIASRSSPGGRGLGHSGESGLQPVARGIRAWTVVAGTRRSTGFASAVRSGRRRLAALSPTGRRKPRRRFRRPGAARLRHLLAASPFCER